MASHEQTKGDLSVENLIFDLQNVMRLAVPARKEWENLVKSGGSETEDTLFSDIHNAVKLAKQETFKTQATIMRENQEAKRSFQLKLEQLQIKNEQHRKHIQQLTEEKMELQSHFDSKCQEINSIKEKQRELQNELRKVKEENRELKAKLESARPNSPDNQSPTPDPYGEWPFVQRVENLI